MIRYVKRYIWPAVAALCLLAAVLPYVDRDVQISASNLYASKWSKVGGSEYVFVGDSITKGGGLWAFRLGAFPPGTMNIARSGYTTEQITPLVRQAAKLNPKAIFYMSGSNDVSLGEGSPLRNREAFRKNLRIARGSGARVIVTLAPPTFDRAINARLAVNNAAMRRLAEAEGVTVIDLWPQLGEGGVIAKRYTNDGTHLTNAAYRIWAREIKRALKAPPTPIIATG
jgi:alpha-glucosidase